MNNDPENKSKIWLPDDTSANRYCLSEDEPDCKQFIWRDRKSKLINDEWSVWFSYASPDFIFRYLKEAASKDTGYIDYYPEHDLEHENLLLSRNEALIYSGLALYGFNSDVLKYLFDNGNKPLKQLILQGRMVEHFDWTWRSLESFIDNRNLSSIDLVLNNSKTAIGFFTWFFEKEDCFSKLSDDDWFVLLLWQLSSSNEQLLRYKYEEFDESRYDQNKLFQAAWSVLERIEDVVSERNRSQLVSISYIISIRIQNAIKHSWLESSPFDYYVKGLFPQFDLEAVLTKWQACKSKYFKLEDNKSNNYEIDGVINGLKWLIKNKDDDVRTRSKKKFLEQARKNDKDLQKKEGSFLLLDEYLSTRRYQQYLRKVRENDSGETNVLYELPRKIKTVKHDVFELKMDVERLKLRQKIVDEQNVAIGKSTEKLLKGIFIVFVIYVFFFNFN